MQTTSVRLVFLAAVAITAGAACSASTGSSGTDGDQDGAATDAGAQDVTRADATATDAGSDATGPDAASDEPATDAASDGTEIDAASDAVEPDAASDATAIDAASDTTETDAAFDSASADAAPDTTAIDAAPDATIVDSAPDATIVDSAPDATIVDSAPDATIVDSAPDATIIDSAPDTAVIDSAPDATAIDATPDVTAADGGGSAEGGSCSASSCLNGCCNGTTCEPFASQTAELCGKGGETCEPCPSGDTCGTTTGTCTAESTGECTWTTGPSASSGEITCYWFGQGTTQGQGCTTYKTYCGYCGTESGSNNGGFCPTGITDSVPNVSTPYFAAFPTGTFGQGKYCGMCVQVDYGGKSIVATIVDECATCSTSAHIDLSLSAAVALGLGQGGTVGDATNGVTWSAVDCPVTGNIVAVYNNGYAGQIYFQDVVFPVAAATADGHTATQEFGYWDFGTSVAGKSVTLNDTLGHVVTGILPNSSGGSVGVQFPENCQ